MLIIKLMIPFHIPSFQKHSKRPETTVEGEWGGSTVLRNRVMKQATTGEYRGGTLVRKGVTSIHVNKEIR